MLELISEGRGIDTKLVVNGCPTGIQDFAKDPVAVAVVHAIHDQGQVAGKGHSYGFIL